MRGGVLRTMHVPSPGAAAPPSPRKRGEGKTRAELARCGVSTFPSLRDLGNAIYAPIPLGWTAPFALRTRTWANESKVPTLVMHSRNDNVIPFRLGQALFDGLTVPKTMYASEARGHCAIEADDGPRYYEAVVQFVKSAR